VEQNLLKSIGQIAIRVGDIERATAFYRDKLGLPFLFQFGELSFFRCGEVRLMLSTVTEEKEFDHPASVMYFNVDDIDAVFTKMSEEGVEFRDKPHMIHKDANGELWMTFFRDGEGNTLALMTTKL
jgi:catechol 2,3-dioxygenase-like lactoylglutathione lyase family enzyme